MEWGISDGFFYFVLFQNTKELDGELKNDFF